MAVRLHRGWFEVGCSEDGACPRCRAFQGEGKELETCPRESGTTSLRVLRLLALARDGHFPVAGGTLAQSSSFLDALVVFSSEMVEMDEFVELMAKSKGERNGKA